MLRWIAKQTLVQGNFRTTLFATTQKRRLQGFGFPPALTEFSLGHNSPNTLDSLTSPPTVALVDKHAQTAPTFHSWCNGFAKCHCDRSCRNLSCWCRATKTALLRRA
ncbi:Uncharacterised protein [Vibrio cholerae]|nr:Uncharacterised protein [Vibrio cholerae]